MVSKLVVTVISLMIYLSTEQFVTGKCTSFLHISGPVLNKASFPRGSEKWLFIKMVFISLNSDALTTALSFCVNHQQLKNS